MANEKIKKIVLAYSGGLDTSVMLRWIKDRFGCEVIAYCADVGQAEETKGLKAKALATGASKLYLEDLREEFARDFVFPMLRANAVYEGYYLLGTSIARPAIAKRQVEIARKERADAVAHGATGKGNDQVRFELTFARLAPDLKIIAPWRRSDWPFVGRKDMIAYANEKRIPITATAEKPYSMDRNLVHISYEGGILEDPWCEPYRDIFRLTAAPENAPNRPEYVEIAYEKGNPAAINGKRMPPARLIERANEIGGCHGIGRADLVENRYVGIKSRGVYETPGVTMLMHGHRAVEQLTLDREAMHLRDSLIPRYAEMVYYGYWFAPEREALQALMDETQKNVNGIARLKLFKGSVSIVGRKSPDSLYDPQLVSFDEAGGYNQADAEGFIRLAGMRLRALARTRGKARGKAPSKD
ncbi:MAG: argininosuccinate synthase [Candidatus Binataceae bacterium]